MSSDPIGFNRERWDELSEAGVEYARPWIGLSAEEARRRIDPEGVVETFDGLDVLCLAASGGQQSVAFGLLGSRVTVFDLSEAQLEKDRGAAAHYRREIRTVQGDMQDLGAFADAEFDLVWTAHAINFVPDARRVVGEITRVMRPGGRTRIEVTNPYVHGAWDQARDDGYLLNRFYEDGAALTSEGDFWVFDGPDGIGQIIEGPIEYRHSLQTVVNALIGNGLTILGLWESLGADPNPQIGSWEHFMRIAPPWLRIWAKKGA